jgi:hypothetical protein
VSDVAAQFEAIARKVAPNKAILSPSGWAYLINDTNEFFRAFLGIEEWSDDQRAAAAQVIADRVGGLAAMDIPYRKFIVPEKPVVYPEHLPPEIRSLPRASGRPAQALAAAHPETVFYLDRHLIGNKALGHLYFRGDTHTNWLGSWLVYRFILQRLIEAGLLSAAGLYPIRSLLASTTPYGGDLLPHLTDAAQQMLERRFSHTMPKGGIELVTKLEIAPGEARARRIETPADYAAWYTTRETLVFERTDGKGPRAVFFRDSTFDRGVAELLAEHCSRSVFVWYSGLVDLDVIEREQPDFVVQAMAERFVVRYPAFRPFYRAENHHRQMQKRAAT